MNTDNERKLNMDLYNETEEHKALVSLLSDCVSISDATETIKKLYGVPESTAYRAFMYLVNDFSHYLSVVASRLY